MKTRTPEEYAHQLAEKASLSREQQEAAAAIVRKALQDLVDEAEEVCWSHFDRLMIRGLRP